VQQRHGEPAADEHPNQPNLAGDFKLVIRTVSAGTEQVLPLPPPVKRGGLFSPISSVVGLGQREPGRLGGDLFISRACCAGVPVRNTSRLMWEVTPAGALVHQVAIGYPNLEHVSLAATGSCTWLATICTCRRTGTRRPS
jgi:hypothetical protein